MIRRRTPFSAVLLGGARELKMTTLNETLKPVPGQTAGQLTVINEISVNPDEEEERKRPAWRQEVFPKKDEHSYLATMYKWGYNSLTLFKKVNEDCGPWWNANCSTLTSNWTQIGDYAAAGLWSGVWRFTYGLGMYNMRPGDLKARSFGRMDKNGALTIDYKETLKANTKSMIMPHTAEHDKHRRFKNPDLPDTTVIESVHGKRILREAQYHLGQSLRFYCVDGYFGAHPGTSTPFRVITDNADHAYAMTINSQRQFNIHAFQEVLLTKRVNHSPLDEWAWRRPGVVVLHCPSYDFEIPRIVEEFGGPRPQDLSLDSPRFKVLDPYSIPMKGIIGADTKVETLVDTVALLCSRWAFYADDQGRLSMRSDSVLNDAGELTVLIHNGSIDVDALRASPHLYGARHHRIADGVVARAWDATVMSTKATETQPNDFVELSHQTVHRPLPTRMGATGGTTLSQRFNNRRNIGSFGYKRSHQHTADPRARAGAAGMLFSKPAELAPRPTAMRVSSTHFVVVGGSTKLKETSADVAAKAVVESLAAGGLYAEPEKLESAFSKMLGEAASLQIVGEKESAAVVAKLAKSGAL